MLIRLKWKGLWDRFYLKYIKLDQTFFGSSAITNNPFQGIAKEDNPQEFQSCKIKVKSDSELFLIGYSCVKEKIKEIR